MMRLCFYSAAMVADVCEYKKESKRSKESMIE